MLGISTVWKSGEVKEGRKLLECFSKLGFNNIELEYRISGQAYNEIKEFLKKERGLRITSIHNFFPIPEITEGGGADVFLLSSEDREERALAVKYTIRTIRIAEELGARVVVLHLGYVLMEGIMKKLFTLYDEGKVGTDEYIKTLEGFKIQREGKKGKSFDMLLLSMDEIIQAAERHDVSLGVENRYSFREYPNFDEMGVIFDKFENGPVGYWHDVGHARVNENLGFVGENQFLEAYGKYLLGFHIHDVNGYSDHHVPGAGEFDFNLLKRYLKEDTIKVLEIHPRETEEDLMDSVDLLKSIGID